MNYTFRLYDFNINSRKIGDDEEDSGIADEDEDTNSVSNQLFNIQMFGLNEHGETCSITVEDYTPFFYVKVPPFWSDSFKRDFKKHLEDKMGPYYKNTIVECSIIKRKKLYGFDGGKEHKFVIIKFTNLSAFNKAKNFWYYNATGRDGESERRLIRKGYKYLSWNLELYEANIPPLLRFFHINEISPSGWIMLQSSQCSIIRNKTTTCTYEFLVHFKNIIPLNDKETRVPYKICSFDIEAGSSHGDFPLPIKNYKKLAVNIVDYFSKLVMEITPSMCKNILKKMILSAFEYDKMPEIDIVYPKRMLTKPELLTTFERWITCKVRDYKTDEILDKNTIDAIFKSMKSMKDDDDTDAEDEDEMNATLTNYSEAATIIDILCDKNAPRELRIVELVISFKRYFPDLKGDPVTFIGSTFLRYGEPEPYLNHCIVLNDCEPLANASLETYNSEREVLLAWRDLIQRENPDIIIGYNIFGFDYNFMFLRAKECNCAEEFLKLSRNCDEMCANLNYKNGQLEIEESKISIASGTHELHYIKMNGRLQIDMYNFFRREENLSSYKLDYVAGYFIGDYVKKLTYTEDETTETTRIYSSNLTGLLVGSFIHFEEISHSTEYYSDGAKFNVTAVNKMEGWFEISTIETPNMSKKVRWCLAKDDVTPKDIFRMTNGTDAERTVIAKYCIQDCNLVHYLANKVDVITGLVEMAKICSVPMSFLIIRGQGIKLTSYVAKKCREKRTLMPVIEKGNMMDGYEGAIVLEPKCNMYLDNPVACVDYASLYPSCMLSENFSHDSKVWTKEFDLEGNLIGETGEKDKDGNFIYDNLESYEYVNVSYDTYKYVNKEKVKSGTKLCRYAQFPEGRAIMPSILEELLTARKTTRKLIPQQTDDFMKNVLDKRQLAYKVTANSLYGQCGAKTSTFYEQDIAASTTATGRLLLLYGKRIIEECYGDRICETENYGPVLTKAEYVYGDTDSVFFTFNLQAPDGTPIRGEKALEITIELAKHAGHLASSFLKAPHDLEYEKTFMPFCLLSKKRYVGMLYEDDYKKGKRKEMGIVLKRRDNAPIVKDIYGGIIDILMKEQNIQKAVQFLNQSLDDIVCERTPIEKLIITKSLSSSYKNPNQIAHKVLANRITDREPGNKPASGDRIPFIYIVNPKRDALQGDKIETPTFIRENKLKIDYSFYITNQIMKPVQQLFSLVLKDIWTMQGRQSKIAQFQQDIQDLSRKTVDPSKLADKIETLKNKEVKALLFDDHLRKTMNKKAGNQAITQWFTKGN
jgi:DNA polymerase elongation subunit (family B)